MISGFISALLQLAVFTLIPFFVYIFRKKSIKGFFDYIGLKRSTTKANLLALLIVLILAGPLLLISYFNQDFKEIMVDPSSMIGKYKAMEFGVSTILLILIDAGIKTSLSEEILFRGFLAKRLINITSFQTGNIIQAIIFGMIHALLFMRITDNIFFIFVIFFFPAMGAYFKTYLNEKFANGSIIPGWIAHGVANVISYGSGLLF